jgi:hypothetical protein
MKFNASYYDLVVEYLNFNRELNGIIQNVIDALIDALKTDVCNFEDKWILFGYGGGKDSTFALTIVRFIQLHILKIHGTTFNLRIVINVQGGMIPSVFSTIKKILTRLEIAEDSKVEVCQVVGNSLRISPDLSDIEVSFFQSEGEKILYAGNQNYGVDNRANFCDFCNVGMVNSFIAAIHPAGRSSIDLIITGDSKEEQRFYYKWVNGAHKQLTQIKTPRTSSFVEFSQKVLSIGNLLYADTFNSAINSQIELSDVAIPPVGEPQFFSLYSLLPYDMKVRMPLLKRVGFEFEVDNLAIAFTETDCFNPLIMAHFFSLGVESWFCNFSDQLNRFSYIETITNYISNFLLPLMQEKKFTESAIDLNLSRFSNMIAIGNTREKIERLLLQHYFIAYDNITFMLFSPIAGNAKNLKLYIDKKNSESTPEERSKLYVNCIKLLTSTSNDETYLVKERSFLEKHSGLSLARLRKLYYSELNAPITGTTEFEVYSKLRQSLSQQHSVRKLDPYKKAIMLGDDLWILATGR